MPELPEVECLTRSVRKYLDGFTCESVEVMQPHLRDVVDIAHVQRVLKKQKIIGVTRRSKYLLIESPKGTCVIHLGMSGQLLAAKQPEIQHKHTHARFAFSNAKGVVKWLHFVDPRRFGMIGAVSPRDLPEHQWFKDLGPEPLATRNLWRHLLQRARGRKQPVKVFLMDAGHVVGVGNIYASESLFRAGISPLREVGSLSEAEFKTLDSCIKATLRAAIAAGGTTIRDYRNSTGERGYFAVRLAVYDREDEPCVQCQRPVSACRQGGRSTFYCAACQS